MARDYGLEEVINEDLDGISGITSKRMFGGLAWLMHGHLLCAASHGGLMMRVGKDKEAWALSLHDVRPMQSKDKSRKMGGWVVLGPDAYADDELRQQILKLAINIVKALD